MEKDDEEDKEGLKKKERIRILIVLSTPSQFADDI